MKEQPTYAVIQIRIDLKKAMEEERLSRDDVANLMRVPISYINMLFSDSAINKVPKIVTTMLTHWIHSKEPLRKWMMTICKFEDYEKFRNKPKTKRKPKPPKPEPAPEETGEQSIEIGSRMPTQEQIEEKNAQSAILAEMESQPCPNNPFRQKPLDPKPEEAIRPTTNNSHSIEGFINHLKESGYEVNITINIAQSHEKN